MEDFERMTLMRQMRSRGQAFEKSATAAGGGVKGAGFFRSRPIGGLPQGSTGMGMRQGGNSLCCAVCSQTTTAEEMEKMADRKSAVECFALCMLLVFVAGVFLVLSMWYWKQGNVRAFQGCLGTALVEFGAAWIMFMDAKRVILR